MDRRRRLPQISGGRRRGTGASQRRGHEALSAHPDGALATLPVGTSAPDFSLPQAPRSLVMLQGFDGRAVVLAFYPMDWEPVSREQLTLYQAYADAFTRLGASLLGISIDHVHSHEAFARDAGLCFPLLADFQPRGLVARRYGVFREARGVSARALFVLDARRVIRFSKAYPDQLNPGVDALLTTLEALATPDDPRRQG
jgi:peroxiredoxin